MKSVIGLAAIIILIASVACYAGVNADFKGAVHVDLHGSRSCTKSFPTLTACEDIVYTLASPDADCFPVFFGLAEWQGFDYSLSWPGMYSCVFTSCSDLTIGGIVNPGDGVSHAWTSCQMTELAVTGWAWIYDYGLVCMVNHPGTGDIKVGDCSDPTEYDNPAATFCAGIGGTAGQWPCENPTQPETWSHIKTMFK